MVEPGSGGHLDDAVASAVSPFVSALMESLPVAVWFKDPDGRYLGCNREFERLYARPEAELLGRVDTEFVDAPTAALFRRQDLLALASDRPVVNEEWVTYASDGRRVLWETTKVAVRDGDGEVIGVLGLGFDITERVAARSEIERERRSLQDAERLAHVGTWEHDLRTDAVSWSPETYRIFGEDPTTFVPANEAFLARVHPDDLVAASREVFRARDTGESFVIQHRIVVAGEVRHVENRGQFVVDGERNPVRLVGSVQDITERVRTADQLEKFYHLVERVADAVILVEVVTGRVAEANTKAKASFGGGRLVGSLVWDIVGEITEDWWRSTIPFLETIPDDLFRFELTRADGSTFPAELSIELVEEDGAYLIVAVRDVSSRVERERLLEQAAQQYRALIGGSKDGFVLVDDHGRIVDVNDVFCEQSGYTRDELTGMPMFELDAEESPDSMRERIERVVATGGEIFEAVHRRKDGSTWPVEVAISHAPLQGGRLFAFLRDLTDRHETEHALRLGAERWSTLLDGTPDGFVRLDSSHRILEVNRQYCEMVGRERAELIGRPITDLDDAMSADDIDAGFVELQARGSMTLHTRLRRSDGTTFPVEISVNYSPVQGGQVYSFVRDVTDRTEMIEALGRSARWFDEVLTGTADGFVVADPHGRVVLVNQRYRELSGYELDELIGMHVTDLDALESAQEVAASLAGVRETGSALFQTVHRRKDGTTWPVEVSTIHTDLDGGRVLTFVRDITDRKQAEEAIRESAESYAALLAGTKDAFCLLDRHGRILEVNDEFCRQSGFDPSEALQLTGADLAAEEDLATLVDLAKSIEADGAGFYDTVLRRKDGATWPVEASITYSPIQGGRLFAFIRDISERRAAERRIRFLAYNDPLTALPNRARFSELLRAAIDRSDDHIVAVCYLDVDDFKPVNDRYGHEAGDAILVQLADRLRRAVTDGDVVARFGGDEFVIMLAGRATLEQVRETARRIVDAVADPFHVADDRVHLSASLGITAYPDDDVDEDALLRHADQAMYRAKELGKNTFQVFDPVADDEIVRRRAALAEFEAALHGGELVLHYQPRIELASGRVVGFEALVRWQHPSRGLLLPAAFLPLIESTPLELALDEWVLDQAIDQLAAWIADGLDLSVSVNISPRHMSQPSCPAYLAQVLARHPAGLAERLELEILETAALGQVEAVASVMQGCTALGVSFALDDFGTGYSSLTYFHSLPVGVLKIDQGFVRRLLADARDFDIVQGVIQLARSTGRPVVAEGVESFEVAMILHRLGCQYAQGYAIARPMEAGVVRTWIEGFASGPWQHLATDSGSATGVHDLDVARLAHVHWAAELIEHVRTGAGGRVPRTTIDVCPLSVWYAGAGRDRFGELAEFVAIASQHERVHDAARELVLHVSTGAAPSELDMDAFHDASSDLLAAIDRLGRAISAA